MNTIRHEVRLEKFRKIVSDISEPDYLQKKTVKISGELMWVIEKEWQFSPGDVDAARKSISPALIEATKDVKPPTGWRRKALTLIYNTSLKPLHRKSFIEGDGAYNFGKLNGLAGDIDQDMQKPETHPESVKLFDSIVTPMLVRGKDIPQFEKGVEIYQKAIEQVPSRPREEQKSYYAGLSSGIHGLIKPDSSITHGHNSTDIYQDFLVLDEYLECLPTRKQIHQFFIYYRGEKAAGKFSTFEKICQDIGYLTPSQIKKSKKSQGAAKRAPF